MLHRAKISGYYFKRWIIIGQVETLDKGLRDTQVSDNSVSWLPYAKKL